ncbi:MAG: hypothetical protein FWD15_00110 [Alphaproteobacteria bacterium]|nr:hypothetical protein [Alphaproteobacteria bacterium]
MAPIPETFAIPTEFNPNAAVAVEEVKEEAAPVKKPMDSLKSAVEDKIAAMAGELLPKAEVDREIAEMTKPQAVREVIAKKPSLSAEIERKLAAVGEKIVPRAEPVSTTTTVENLATQFTVHEAEAAKAPPGPVCKNDVARCDYDTHTTWKSAMLVEGTRIAKELAAEFKVYDESQKPGHLSPAQIKNLKQEALANL